MRSFTFFDSTRKRGSITATIAFISVLAFATLNHDVAFAEQPPAPCHPNLHAKADIAMVKNRGDIRHLPAPLENRLVQFASRE